MHFIYSLPEAAGVSVHLEGLGIASAPVFTSFLCLAVSCLFFSSASIGVGRFFILGLHLGGISRLYS